MDGLQLDHRYRCAREARLALAGAVAAVCALIASPGPALAQQFFTCTPNEAGVFVGMGISANCHPGFQLDNEHITFFSLSVANPDASRVLSLIETAVVARKPLRIQFDPNNTSGVAIGCRADNCRLIISIGLESQ